jgi:hypothetical protein
MKCDVERTALAEDTVEENTRRVRVGFEPSTLSCQALYQTELKGTSLQALWLVYVAIG